LKGFRLRDVHIPNNTNSRMNEILTPLASGGVFEGLIDKNNFQFRYLIDTFNHGIEANSKSIYAKLCKARQNVFAILNAPRVDEFKNSTNPYFKQAPTPEKKDFPFESRYVATGGNLERNPSVVYSLPQTKDGASYVAFFGPNVIMKDRNKDISVPPAMFVGNLFNNKLSVGNA
jgi:hypothetical protein